MDQIIKLGRNDEVGLSTLRKLHRENKFVGQCIVFFDPALFTVIINLPNFRYIDDYKYTKPVHEDEIGEVEVFRMCPISPIEYLDII